MVCSYNLRQGLLFENILTYPHPLMLESYWQQFLDLAYYISDFLYFFRIIAYFAWCIMRDYVMEIAGYLIIFEITGDIFIFFCLFLHFLLGFHDLDFHDRRDCFYPRYCSGSCGYGCRCRN